MAQKFRLKVHPPAVRKLLQSAEVQRDLRGRVARGQAAAGPGFKGEVNVVGGSSKLGRAMGYLKTADAKGRRRQAKDPVLQRALKSMK